MIKKIAEIANAHEGSPERAIKIAKIAGEMVSLSQVEEYPKNIWPENEWNKRHLQFIFFGREYCPARTHNLSSCPICSWAATKKRIQKENGNMKKNNIKYSH